MSSCSVGVDGDSDSDISDLLQDDLDALSTEMEVEDDETPAETTSKKLATTEEEEVLNTSNNNDAVVRSAKVITNVSITEDDIGKFYAVLYTEPRTYYWGKLLKLFSDDEDTAVTKAELDFLKRDFISSDVAQQTWKERAVKDISIVSVLTMFYGPVKPTLNRGSSFQFPDKLAKQKFDELTL